MAAPRAYSVKCEQSGCLCHPPSSPFWLRPSSFRLCFSAFDPLPSRFHLLQTHPLHPVENPDLSRLQVPIPRGQNLRVFLCFSRPSPFPPFPPVPIFLPKSSRSRPLPSIFGLLSSVACLLWSVFDLLPSVVSLHASIFPLPRFPRPWPNS